MARSGLSLPVRILVILVLGMAVVALLAGSFYSRTVPFVSDQETQANSSTLRNCEERIQAYCDLHEGGDWSDRLEECVQYKDSISNGNTQCE
jgi:type II secretory pathway pseudopilin PulG